MTPIEAKDTVMSKEQQDAAINAVDMSGLSFGELFKCCYQTVCEAQAEISFKAGIEKGRQMIITHVEKYFKNAKITAFTGEGGFTQIIMPNEDWQALKGGKDK